MPTKGHLARHELELAVKLASIDLIEFTERSGFLLEMPSGNDQPPHYVVVGTAEEIGWLLRAHAAKPRPPKAPRASAISLAPDRH
jgi:hypothetical protein